MELSELYADKATVKIPFGGEDHLTVTYRPSVGMTPELLIGTLSAVHVSEDNLEAAGTAIEAIVTFLSESIVSWDLTDGGEPVPTDAATLRRLPLTLLTTVQAAIQNHMTRAEGKAKPSRAGSRRKAK